MRRVLFLVLVITLVTGGVAFAQGAAVPSAAQDEKTAQWQQKVNAKLDQIMKEADRTGNPEIKELARQIRDTVLKVRKIENGGNGGQ